MSQRVRQSGGTYRLGLFCDKAGTEKHDKIMLTAAGYLVPGMTFRRYLIYTYVQVRLSVSILVLSTLRVHIDCRMASLIIMIIKTYDVDTEYY